MRSKEFANSELDAVQYFATWREVTMIATPSVLKESPLQNGDHLDQKTFHTRYEATSEDFRAELIGGIVYLQDRWTISHGRLHMDLGAWLCEYGDATPVTEGLLSVTAILGPRSEPEPDGCLLILPEFGGQTWEDDEEYLNGAPEWVGE